jgi:Family of unknown function (DUF6365)
VRNVNVLFVTPSEVSSGESVTALHMAEWLRTEGCAVHFLASGFTASFIRSRLPDAVTQFGSDLSCNQSLWAHSLQEFRPTQIVFCDYPLLALRSGAIPLRDKHWENRLDECDAEIFTLDHLGYAQRARLIFFGPAHDTLGIERIPATPSRIHVLLPCPLHDPIATSLRGQPFRFWNSRPDLPEADHTQGRVAYVRSAEEILILHIVSGWAVRAAELIQSPYYLFLPRLLSYYLRDLARPVTVLSVNDGSLMPETKNGNVRFINTGPVAPSHYERLLQASDLILTENRISVSLAKAIHLGKNCAVLHNTYTLLEILNSQLGPPSLLAQQMEQERLGSVFPFEVLPIWGRGDLEELGIFDKRNELEGVAEIEIFGGDATTQQLRALLTDNASRERMRASQSSYLARIESLPSPLEALRHAQSHARSYSSAL